MKSHYWFRPLPAPVVARSLRRDACVVGSGSGVLKQPTKTWYFEGHIFMEKFNELQSPTHVLNFFQILTTVLAAALAVNAMTSLVWSSDDPTKTNASHDIPTQQVTLPRVNAATFQRYGKKSERIAFQSVWRDSSHLAFGHQSHATFHRLRTTFDALYSRCEQPVSLVAQQPVRITVKMLAYAEVNRSLVRIGLKSVTHGSWAYSVGAVNGLFGKTGWNIMANAANPLEENVSLAGFDNRDWHTFVLLVSNNQEPAKLFCDGQYVMDLETLITDEQRDKVREAQNGIHGSTQQLVPETEGQQDYIFIESRHPGQIIDVDSIEISQEPRVTSRKTLPVLLDLDWDLDGMRIVENTLKSDEVSPVLRKAEAPYPIGIISWDDRLKRYARQKETAGWSNVSVLKDEEQFHLYVNDVYEEFSDAAGRVTFCTYHVGTSKDGVHWELKEPTLVVHPGEPTEWDAGTASGITAMKENGVFRLWYGAYPARLQQGRTGYAESSDGIHWNLPKLGLFQWNGQETNICYSLQAGPTSNEYELPSCVIRADEATPERRYVMFLHTQGPHGFIVDVAISPDGLRWTRSPHNARHHAFVPADGRLTLHKSPKVLHEPHYWWAFAGQQQGNVFFGWAVEPEEFENVSFGLWRGRGRQHAIHGQMLEVGDQWWIYYTKDGDLHLGQVGRHRMYGLELADGKSGSATCVGWRRPEDGFSGYQLSVNISGLSEGCHIRAELIDAHTNRILHGYALEDSHPIRADAHAAPLQWKSSGVRLPDVAAPIRARLHVTRAEGNPQIHAVYLRRMDD